jgi:hypothetical protein
MTMPPARVPSPAIDARQEAIERLGGRYDARVLEPSPPAVHEPPWFADDPVDAARGDVGLPIVSPVTSGEVSWDELARDDPELAGFCAERWLGAYRRLPPTSQLPPTFAATRDALQALAEHVLAPTRARANGKVGLRFTRGGFGTPFFGRDVQVRVAGDVLTLQAGERVEAGRVTTLADAAEFIGFDLTRFDVEQHEEALEIDAAAAELLGDWFGFAASVLEQLRCEADAAGAASRVQLWPEHFDMAFELGAEQGGRRATYGCSPGDELHPLPYVYVAPWIPQSPSPLWNADGFRGAELGYEGLAAAADQRAATLQFFRERAGALGLELSRDR